MESDWRPKVLVMSGGSVRGIFTAGALLILQKFGYLDQVHTFAGTSIGGIIAGFLCMGYKAEEIADAFYQTDFAIILEHINFGSFFKDSICDSSFISDFIHKHIKDKLGSDMTLKELYDKTGKMLTMITVRKRDNRKIILNHINTPDVTLADAMLQTSCVPALLQDVVRNGDTFWDGALIDNYPVAYFDPDEVLGIYLGPRYYEAREKPVEKEDVSLLSLLKPKSLSKIQDMVNMLMCTIEYMRLKDVSIREIYIDTKDADSFSFDMKQADKIKYLMNGMGLALQFVQNPKKKPLYNGQIYD